MFGSQLTVILLDFEDFCLLVGLHLGWSATNGSTPSNFDPFCLMGMFQLERQWRLRLLSAGVICVFLVSFCVFLVSATSGSCWQHCSQSWRKGANTNVLGWVKKCSVFIVKINASNLQVCDNLTKLVEEAGSSNTVNKFDCKMILSIDGQCFES